MIAIIGAMSEEVLEIRNLMTKVVSKTISKIIFYEGLIQDKKVVLVQSGIGKTLSALSTTVLVLNYEVDFVINVGSAGGITSDLKPLDVIVSERVAQADFDLTAFGYKKDFSEQRLAFYADNNLVHKMKSLNLPGVIYGDIVSSDTFISKQSQVNTIIENFPTALCADMEAGSIAMTLAHFNIPFIVIRSISDVVGSQKDNALEFQEYLALASKNSAKITKELIINS
ncbi:MAG: 5'-methylthioadenosine/adenosylhomocysteine nucleosidase [Erysipelothrix sp.]|nr:5'-methylthioadenosine/adenosylhomocysteine nucleosidase [Erysipelothrix sp.]